MQPSLTWVYEGSGNGYSNILLADGRLVMLHGDGMLCVDSRNGEQLWALPQIFGQFLISDGVVYYQQIDSLDQDNTVLVGLDIETGERIIWRWHLKDVSNFIIADTTVYVSCRSGYSHSSSMYADKVISFSIANVHDIHALWELDLSDFTVNSLSLVDTVLIASLDNVSWRRWSEGIAAISTVSGNLLWKLENDSIANGFIPVTNETLFIRVSDNLQAINLHDGSLIWSISDSLQSNPAIKDDALFYLSAASELVEVSVSTGAEINSSDMPSGTIRRGTTISLANNGIFIQSGRIILKLDYDLILKWIYSRFNVCTMIIHGGNLYLASSTMFFCLSD